MLVKLFVSLRKLVKPLLLLSRINLVEWLPDSWWIWGYSSCPDRTLGMGRSSCGWVSLKEVQQNRGLLRVQTQSCLEVISLMQAAPHLDPPSLETWKAGLRKPQAGSPSVQGPKTGASELCGALGVPSRGYRERVKGSFYLKGPDTLKRELQCGVSDLLMSICPSSLDMRLYRSLEAFQSHQCWVSRLRKAVTVMAFWQ